MPEADTKTAILDAAERLFADVGFAATSLRQLTTEAGANLAAVNYHFGSKERLAIAVLTRRIAPINDERRRRLDALRARPTVSAIVRAFVEPVLCAQNRSGAPSRSGVPSPSGAPIAPTTGFARLFGRLMVEQPPFLRPFLSEQFRELGWRFVAVVQVALPGHDASALWWRLHFLVGALSHTLQNAPTLTHLTNGLCRHDDSAAIAAQLVAFASAGLAAPTDPHASRRRRRTDTRRGARR
jgi:AcrR family transcriptional regulator